MKRKHSKMVVLTLRNIPIPQDPVLVNTVEETKFDRLPDKYDPNTWPAYTSLQCYNCTLTSKRIPLFIPTGRSNGKLTRGNGPIYCSTGCMQRSLLDMKLSDSDFKKRSDLSKELIYLMFGVTVEVITPANDRIVLKRFAGTKTDAEFQEEVMHFCDFIQKCYKNYQDFLEDSK